MLQKAFSSQFSPSMPIPLWQEINLRADRWKHQQGRGRLNTLKLAGMQPRRADQNIVHIRSHSSGTEQAASDYSRFSGNCRMAPLLSLRGYD
jgi:hypothetical protein